MSIRLYRSQGFRETLVKEIKLFEDEDESIRERQRCERLILPDGRQVCRGCYILDALIKEATQGVAALRNGKIVTSVIKIHSTVTSLWECADHGCVTCHAIRKQIFLKKIRSQDDVDRFLEIFHQVDMYYSNSWSTNDDGTLVLRVHQPGGQLDEFMPANRFPDAAETPSDSQNFYKKISGCLEECVRKHPGCRSQGPRSLPGRLIKLRTGENGDDVCLVDDFAEDVNYSALSYCWGDEGSNFGITTSKNVEERKQSFSPGSLPKTIRNTISVCRELQIPYLWIDSLCILQDAPADWQKEASKMGGIYSNAVFTLVASSSRDANDGLTSIHGRDTAPWMLGGLTFRYQSPLVNELFRGPLSGRAWTLQEEYLSPRKLYWTFHGVFFSCQRYIRDINAGVWPTPVQLQLKTLDSDDDAASLFASNMAFVSLKASRDEAYLAWEAARKSYLQRRLSKQEDRLPAIQGLATLVEKQTGDQCLWGLWKNKLPKDLFWFVKTRTSSKGSLGSVTAPKRVPSWSWACLRGNLEARYYDTPSWLIGSDDQDVSLKFVKISPKGHLTLRAPRTQLTEMEFYQGEPKNGTCNSRDRPYHYIEDFETGLFPSLYLDNQSSSTPNWSSLYCLGRHVIREEGYNHIKTYEDGLLLERAGPETFRRVGIWHAYTQPIDGETPKELVQGKYKATHVSNFHGCKTHVTTLV